MNAFVQAFSPRIEKHEIHYLRKIVLWSVPLLTLDIILMIALKPYIGDLLQQVKGICQ
jgi:hypothetical protein